VREVIESVRVGNPGTIDIGPVDPRNTNSGFARRLRLGTLRRDVRGAPLRRAGPHGSTAKAWTWAELVKLPEKTHHRHSN